MEYLLKNKLLSNRQYGFIKGRSTLLQLLNMLDKWTHGLESGGQIDAIYTDFEKAFEKVPHKRLLNKIRSYGFPRELTNWIEALLLGRKYRVRINIFGLVFNHQWHTTGKCTGTTSIYTITGCAVAPALC